MTYRELLEYIKNNPGCLAANEQKDQEAYYRFKDWVEQQRSQYQRIQVESEDYNN